MPLLPIFLNLANRPCLLVGAGNVALDKIGTLLPTGLTLRVIAPEAREEIRQLAAEGKLQLDQRPFQPEDVENNFIVIAATNSAEVNAAVYQACLDRNIPCNSVDDIPNCDFFFGSIVSRGPLQIAISTSGGSPAVAQRLRREIDAQLPQDLGPWLEKLGALRREVLETHPSGEARKSLLHQLAQRQLCESAACPTRQLAVASLANPRSLGAPGPSHLGTWETTDAGNTHSERAFVGSVALVGAGPGDPDLLTVKALRLIQTAQVILHDDLVPPAILTLASPSAEAINVGKRCGSKTITQDEINALMVAHARANQSVVRLKSGDPLIFGRAAEEMSALTAAGIPFQVVPGITAAFAAAAALGCSLTDRNAASNVTFSTGHHAQSHNHAPIPEIEDTTRVVYMPGRDLKLLAAEWLAQGLPPDFPCALVSHAGQPAQQIRCCTLAALGDAEPVPAPSLIIAGWAVREPAAAAQPAAHGAQVTA